MVPDFFQSVIWSGDIKQLRPTSHRRTLVTAAINYGDLKHWRWLAKEYGLEGVRQTLRELPASALRPRAARLARLLFQIQGFDHASRHSHA